jgi:GTPase SAR1 family protein
LVEYFEPSRPASYSAYNRSLIRVAAGLSAVVQIAERVGATTAAEAARTALDHLERGTFIVAVVGEFKRGKSTFINALLGQEVLPADVLPTTAVVNRIVYGREPSCTLRLADGAEQSVPIGELADYVTKLTAEAASRAASVIEAVVAFPTLLCQNNIQVVDTPGLGDEAAMTARTMAVLPTADAAIMLVSALSPFAQSEQGLLRELLKTVPAERVFIVMNQIDLLPGEAQVARVLVLIESRAGAVLREIGADKIRVVALSALDALEAKMQRDHARFTASRFAAFEELLEEYLARDRGFATLQRAANALAVSSQELLVALQSRRDQAVISRERGINALRERIDGLMALQQHAQSLCEQAEPNAEALANSLKAAGPELAEQLRARAAQAADTVMDADWTAKPPAHREAILNMAVHQASLPLIAECADALTDRSREWARGQLSEVVAAEAALANLVAEPHGVPVSDQPNSSSLSEKVDELLAALVPDMHRPAKVRHELVQKQVDALLDFPRRLNAPDSLAAIDGTATSIQWVKEPGEACVAGERIARLAKDENEIWVVAPTPCRLSWIAPNARGTLVVPIAAGGLLGFLEPRVPAATNLATGGALCELRNAAYLFHLDWDPDRPAVEQNTAKQLAASAIGTAGRWLRGTNETLKGFDRLRRTLEAGTSYLDRQLRVVTLANIDAALHDEMSRLRLRDLPAQLAAETSGVVRPIRSQRASWIAEQAMRKTEELRLRLERQTVLLERELAESQDLEGQVHRIGDDAERQRGAERRILEAVPAGD